jgi:hypothetical protein
VWKWLCLPKTKFLANRGHSYGVTNPAEAALVASVLLRALPFAADWATGMVPTNWKSL